LDPLLWLLEKGVFHTSLAHNLEGVVASLEATKGQELSSGEDNMDESDEEASQESVEEAVGESEEEVVQDSVVEAINQESATDVLGDEHDSEAVTTK